MSDNLTPDALEAFIGGYLGMSYAVAWEAGKLVYRCYGYGYAPETEESLVPIPADWAAFWATIEQVGVWGWEERYEPPPGVLILDGTGWSLTLRYGGRFLRSSGTNAFPPGFDRFCEAMSRLVGGRQFA